MHNTSVSSKEQERNTCIITIYNTNATVGGEEKPGKKTYF